MLRPAFVKCVNACAKLPAQELVTIASTSVRFALTLLLFQYLVCFLRIAYDNTQNTIFRRIRNSSSNDPYIFFSKQSQVHLAFHIYSPGK